MRKGAVVIFALLGALLVLAAVNAVWAERTLVDEGAFGRVTVASLQTDRVSGELAAEVWNVLLVQYPPLEALDGVEAKAALAEVLRRPGARDTLLATALQAHRVVVGGWDEEVVLDLSADRALVLEAVFAMDPGLADALPAGAGVDPVVLARSGELPDLSRVAWATPWITWFSGVMGALALLLALALAERRGAAIGVIGSALLSAAALEVLALALLPGFIGGRVSDAFTADLASAYVQVLAPGLRSALVVVAAVGLVLGGIGLATTRRGGTTR
jgi:hypothetical protein